jgi:MFS family permease
MPKAARLTALNFGAQTVWGAILAVSLQDRVVTLTGGTGATLVYALLAAGGAFVATVVQILVGVAADARRERVGHRLEFFIGGAALAAPALFFFYAAPSIALLALAYVLLQVGMNAIMAPLQAVVPDYVRVAEQGRASGWLSGYGSLGGTCGLLIAGFVHPQLAIAGALCAVLASTLVITVAHVRGLVAQPVTRSTIVWRGPLATLLLSRGTINIGFYTVIGFLLFFVRESLGIDAAGPQRTQTALLFITFSTSAIVGAACAGRPADRIDKRVLITVCGAALIASFIGLAAAQSLAMAYPAMALAGLAWGGFIVADWALAFALLPRGSMATALSIWNVANTAPQVVAPLLAAPVVAYGDGIMYGLGPRVAIALCSLTVVAGVALIWRLPRASTSLDDAHA